MRSRRRKVILWTVMKFVFQTIGKEGLLTAHRQKKSDGKTLVGALSVQKLLLYAPVLRWYAEHGAVIKTVHRTIDYHVTKFSLGVWSR